MALFSLNTTAKPRFPLPTLVGVLTALRALRPTPRTADDILSAQARRKDARRAADRLLR